MVILLYAIEHTTKENENWTKDKTEAQYVHDIVPYSSLVLRA